ncbi:MAG: response regulator [Bacteroidales bacterium]|nr:MAG: response regulator [Bacteroidales bacterium]
MRKIIKYLIVFSVILLISFFSFLCNSQIQQLNSETQNLIHGYLLQVEKYEKENNKIEAANYLNKVAYIYLQNGSGIKSIDYFKKSLSINEELGNKNAVITINNNLGFIYSEYGDYHSAHNYFNKSLSLCREQNKKWDIASGIINVSQVLSELKDYEKSNEGLEEALNLGKEINNFQIIKNCYELLYKNYEKLGNSKKSLEYFDLYVSLQKHLQKKELESLETRTKEAEAKAFAKELQLMDTKDTLNEVVRINREMQLKNQLLNKEKALKDLALKEEKARRGVLEARVRARRIVLFTVVSALLLMTLILALIYVQFNQKKKANELLHDQNIEIEKQRDIANIQKQKITDSIQYAQRIQNAILPPRELLDNLLHDYFVLYRPKDIVSGDFYWITQKENILVLTAADCTGHGVPGGFMSMLGVAFLNEIVNKIVINKHISSLQADNILNELRVNIIRSLHQTGRRDEPKDGMDIALCIIDFDENKLQFAGARNPLVLIRNGELIHYKADRMTVSYSHKMNQPFTKHEIKLEINDAIYLFTDGYCDQFGGDEDLKFGSNNLKELLLSISQKPMREQREILISNHEEWKGARNQLDDILVIGFKYAGKRKVLVKEQKYNWEDKNILIAEDTDINYYFLAEVLKSTNARLIRVNNGKEAVEYCQSNNVDLILMDINMPRMNGFEATRSIKEHKNDIPIIVQTAVGFENEEELSLESGADDYISKPIDLKSFMNKLEKFLG